MGLFFTVVFSIVFVVLTLAFLVFLIMSYSFFVNGIIENSSYNSSIKSKEDFMTSLIPFGYFWVKIKNDRGFN